MHGSKFSSIGGWRESRQNRAVEADTYPENCFYPVPMQRFLVIAGIVLLVAGLAWPWLSRLPFGRLPGDIHVVREGFSFHFPIVTSIVISVLVSILFWIFRK